MLANERFTSKAPPEVVQAEREKLERYRRELDALAADGFAAVANDMNHLASLAGLAQGAAALGDAPRAEALYTRLLPYRSRTVLIGRGAVCLGPVEFYLGVLASTCMRLEDADAHLDAATSWARDHDARPWQAWSTALRAETQRRRDAPGADSLAAEALATAVELGIGRLVARLRAGPAAVYRDGA